MVYIAAFYNDQTQIDDYFRTTIEAFKKENIEFDENILLNGTAPQDLDVLLDGTDVVFLAGGHLPTQNTFFMNIQLDRKLRDYQGILVAQSAGSMNCASNVYVCPEVPGEAVDPGFQRYRPGLGLTDLNIIPHDQKYRHAILDGLKFYEEVIAPDTYRTPLYLLADGAFSIWRIISRLRLMEKSIFSRMEKSRLVLHKRGKIAKTQCITIASRDAFLIFFI